MTTSPSLVSGCLRRTRNEPTPGIRIPIRFLLATAVAALMTISVPSATASQPEPGRHPMTFVASWDGTEQPYYLFVPSRPQPSLPLAIVLHGKGANWKSWFEATTVCEWAEKEGIAVLSPHGRGDWFYTGPGESDTLDAIREVKELLPIDPDRVYLLGHSMGGWGAWHLGLSHPNIFAAIVPMATWPPLPRIAAARHLAPFLVHGADDDIIPPIGSRVAAQHLETLGILHKYHEVPDRGHESVLISESLDVIGDWLRGWERVTNSPHVHLASYTPRRGANQWLQLARVHRWTDLATIDARAAEGYLDILTRNSLSFFASPPADLVGSDIQIRIDGTPLHVSEYGNGSALFLNRESGGWKVEVVPSGKVQAPEPRVLHQIGEQERNLPRLVAEAVAKAIPEASVVLIPDDLVAPEIWPGDFTEDHLLDMFLHEEDMLYFFHMTAGEAREILENQQQWFPPWWVGLTTWKEQLPDEDDARAVIVAPEVLAKRLPAFGRPAGTSLRRALYDVFRLRGYVEPSHE